MANKLATMVVVLTALAVSACGDTDDAPAASASGGTSSGGSSSGGGGSSGSSGTGSADGGSKDAATDGGIPADCGGDEGGPVPATPNEVNAWLQTRKYECWARESAVHLSAGPHVGNVRTYLNAALDASMKGSAEHPQGAAVVKEFYGQGTTTVTGWAVAVKTQAQSASGQGWYWYEVFGTDPGATTIEGQGLGKCTGCHSGGKDYVLTPYPLQ